MAAGATGVALLERHLRQRPARGAPWARVFGGEVHVFSAAYTEGDLREILEIADHVVFNSCAQWLRFRPLALAARERRPGLKFGLRINPEHSEGRRPSTTPARPFSRLGIPLSSLDEPALDISRAWRPPLPHALRAGFSDRLPRTRQAVEEKFGQLLRAHEVGELRRRAPHHAARLRASTDLTLVRDFPRYDVEVYLEPGEAIAINTGVLVATVLGHCGKRAAIAILDTSATVPHAGRARDALPPGHPEAPAPGVTATPIGWAASPAWPAT